MVVMLCTPCQHVVNTLEVPVILTSISADRSLQGITKAGDHILIVETAQHLAGTGNIAHITAG